MKLIVRYVVQGEASHRYRSEMLELDLVPPLYSTRPHQHESDNKVMRLSEEKQKELNTGELEVVLNTLYS